MLSSQNRPYAKRTPTAPTRGPVRTQAFAPWTDAVAGAAVAVAAGDVEGEGAEETGVDGAIGEGVTDKEHLSSTETD